MSETAKSAPYVVAVIHKDAVEHLPVTVHVFEVRVLQQLHGADKVTIDEGADLPGGLTEVTFEPEDEFSRLEQRYGFDPDTKQSYVAQAYGGFPGFLDELEAAGADGEPVRKAKPAAKGSKAKAAATS
jgi:hypothetical protein